MAPTASGSGSPDSGRKKSWEVDNWSKKVGKTKKPEKLSPKKLLHGLEKQASSVNSPQAKVNHVEGTMPPGMQPDDVQYVQSAQDPSTPMGPPPNPGLQPFTGPMDTPSTGGKLPSPMQPFPQKATGQGHQFGPNDTIPGLQPVPPQPQGSFTILPAPPHFQDPVRAVSIPSHPQGPSTTFLIPPAAQGPPVPPHHAFGYPNYPTQQGPLAYQHSTTNPMDPNMVTQEEEDEVLRFLRERGLLTHRPPSEVSDEFVIQATHKSDPFVDSQRKPRPPRRDLIQELVDFKKKDESTGYPLVETTTGVPWHGGKLRMPIPAPDATPPAYGRRTDQDIPMEYPGDQIGEYSMLRGGKRDRWPDRDSTQLEDDVAALDLKPGHEGTSVLEHGSPQELKLLGPALANLGKIKRGPWKDRHNLAKRNAATATPLPLPLIIEADTRHLPRIPNSWRLYTAHELGFFHPKPGEAHFVPEYHARQHEYGQMLLTRQEADDVVRHGRVLDRESGFGGHSALSREEQLRRHFEWEKQFNVRPSSDSTLQQEAEDDDYEEQMREMRREQEQDRIDQERNRKHYRDLEEDDQMGDTDVATPAKGGHVFMASGSVFSGTTLAGNDRPYDNAPSTPSDDGVPSDDGGLSHASDSSEDGRFPLRNERTCNACLALNLRCAGGQPCVLCVRDRIQCRMPPRSSPSRSGSSQESSLARPRRGPGPAGFMPEDIESIGGDDEASSDEEFVGPVRQNPQSSPPNAFGDGIVGLPATEHWAANGPPEVGTGPNLGPCDYCIATESADKCKPNHDLQLECAACAGARVRGDLGHQCFVRGVEYRPRRHVATRNRYKNIRDAIVYRCDECDKNRIDACDVDPFVRTGCSHCARTGKQCSWHVDRRRPPDAPGNVLAMLPRPSLRENNNVGILRLTPWWRRGCLACFNRGDRCTWLNDYRTIGYRCAGCTHQFEPCIDAEAPNLRYHARLDIGNRVFYDGPRVTDPRVVARLVQPGNRGACRTCSIFVDVEGSCGAEYTECLGWAGAAGYACLRCTALGLPCVANFNRPNSELPAILPYADRELIGYGSGYVGSALTFPACKHCVENDRWCDRMRPCHECHIRDLDCSIDPNGGENHGLGLIPRDEFEDMGIELRPEYWMAHGYGPDGPSGDRSGIETGEIAGPVELTWAMYGPVDMDVSIAGEEPPLSYSIIRQREPTISMVPAGASTVSDPEVPRGEVPQAAPAGSSPNSIMTFHTLTPPGMSLDPNVIQPELPPWTPEERRFSGFINGFRQRSKILVNGVVVDDPNPRDPNSISFVNTPRPASSHPAMPTINEDFNSSSGFFNSVQPEGVVMGSNVDPFAVAQDAAGRIAHHDNNFLRQLAEQGPSTGASGRDIWSDVAELAGIAPEDRFARGHLGIHEGVSLGLVPDGRQAPVRERVLLTFEGRDAATVTALNPFVPPPDRNDMAARTALARHFMSNWESPSIDVLRDIPETAQILPLPEKDHRCQDHGFTTDEHPCGAQLGRQGASHCENLQHIAGQAPYNIQPKYVCAVCDETTSKHILVGPHALTIKDFTDMRTYACDDCTTREYSAPGVVGPLHAKPVTGCSCATKLLFQRLCAAHRYTLASALVINTLIVREWQLVNFPPSFCMFCKKIGRNQGKGKAIQGSQHLLGVFFCANCQTRVADPERENLLFYGAEHDQHGNVRADPRGQRVVELIQLAEEGREAGVAISPEFGPF